VAAKRDIEIIRGDDYAHLLTFVDENHVPLDLTGYTGAAQIRRDPAAVGTPEATFTVTFPNPIDGEVLLTLTDAQTTALPAVKCTYSWDLELTITGQTTTLIGGKVSIVQDVTHS
jgi:hypothetical protein